MLVDVGFSCLSHSIFQVYIPKRALWRIRTYIVKRLWRVLESVTICKATKHSLQPASFYQLSPISTRSLLTASHYNKYPATGPFVKLSLVLTPRGVITRLLGIWWMSSRSSGGGNPDPNLSRRRQTVATATVTAAAVKIHRHHQMHHSGKAR